MVKTLIKILIRCKTSLPTNTLYEVFLAKSELHVLVFQNRMKLTFVSSIETSLLYRPQIEDSICFECFQHLYKKISYHTLIQQSLQNILCYHYRYKSQKMHSKVCGVNIVTNRKFFSSYSALK